MNKSSKKFLTQTVAASLLCMGTVLANNFSASDISSLERERAARIQQSEFQKHYYSSCETVRAKIQSNEEQIKALEKNFREVLDSELATFLQVEEDLKSRINDCAWWSMERWDLNTQLSDVRRKISNVKSKIAINNDNIEKLKKIRKSLDAEYAAFLQNQELYGMY